MAINIPSDHRFYASDEARSRLRKFVTASTTDYLDEQGQTTAVNEPIAFANIPRIIANLVNERRGR